MWLYVWGLGALVCPERFANALTEIDCRRVLARNEQLARADEAVQQRHRADVVRGTIERARLLRRKLLGSFTLLASAAVLAWVTRVFLGSVGVSVPTSGDGWLQAASLGLLVWATLGRLGWEGQTVSGTSAIERLDDAIFRALYWLGSFLGIFGLAGSFA